MFPQVSGSRDDLSQAPGWPRTATWRTAESPSKRVPPLGTFPPERGCTHSLEKTRGWSSVREGGLRQSQLSAAARRQRRPTERSTESAPPVFVHPTRGQMLLPEPRRGRRQHLDTSTAQQWQTVLINNLALRNTEITRKWAFTPIFSLSPLTAQGAIQPRRVRRRGEPSPRSGPGLTVAARPPSCSPPITSSPCP